MARMPLGIETDVASNSPAYPNPREKKILEAMREDKNLVDTFPQALVVSNFDNVDGTIYTGATGEVLSFDSGNAVYEVYQAAVAAAAVIAPYQSSAGLNVQRVGVGDALELGLGTTALSRGAYVTGSMPGGRGVFMEVTMTIADISDVTEMFVGWRKAEAYQADPDSYANVAAFHIGASDDGRISITTSVGSTETVVDTTLADWADTEEHVLRVEVLNSGVCSFKFDNATPTVTVVGFTFPAALTIVPFIHINGEAATDGNIITIERLEVGIQ